MKFQGDAPLVSVCVVAYNQSEYIRQCLLSILDQETDFSFEVIVGDDASTDGTAKTIEELAVAFPGQVVPVIHSKNIGPTRNYLSVHNKARGKYVAHCDGDDYWLPGKLAYQISLLEANPNIAFVGETTREFGERRLFDINALLEELNPVVHSSKVYRRENVITRETSVELLDFYLNVEHVRDGFAYLEKVKYTAYRVGIGVLRNVSARYYFYNCDAAMRAYSLGASRSAAHWAAREARYRVLKNAAFEKKWDQIDAVISASAIEQELAGKVGVELAGLLRYKVAKIAFHLLMRVKRGIISV